MATSEIDSLIPARAVTVFFSYAHEDERLRDELAKHLAVLRRQGIIEEWHDRKIGAGMEWKNEIDRHIESANVILLLVSPDFLASDYCFDVEVNRAMVLHESGRARVIPIILRPVVWQDTPFSKLQALPKDARPVTAWGDYDAAFYDVSCGIQATVRQMYQSQVKDQPKPGCNAEEKSVPGKGTTVLPKEIDALLKYYEARGAMVSDLISMEALIDYSRLERLLEATDWIEADEETWRIMLKISGKDRDERIEIVNLSNFPCRGLRTVDRLWQKSSKGRFGFSTQANIWQAVKKKGDEPWETFVKLGERVGWFREKESTKERGLFTEIKFSFTEGASLSWLKGSEAWRRVLQSDSIGDLPEGFLPYLPCRTVYCEGGFWPVRWPGWAPYIYKRMARCG